MNTNFKEMEIYEHILNECAKKERVFMPLKI